MLILALIPLLNQILITAIFYFKRTFRESIYLAAVINAGWCALLTELLGSIHALRFWPVFIGWIVPVVAMVVYMIKARKSFKKSIISIQFREIGWFGGTLVGLISLILLIVLATAMIAPPNNGDSLNYNLPRIIAWQQQNSLADFPTSCPMQIVYPGLLEYYGLNSMILGHGNDRAVNLFDWMSFLLLGLAGSSIAKNLGADRNHQLLAMLFILTMPMAFGMATTFKPEILEAVWVEIIALWILEITRERHCSNERLAAVSVAFGLSALTHGTGYVFGITLSAFTIVAFWRCYHWACVRPIIIIAITVLALNAGYLSRNLAEFGRPFGMNPDGHQELELINTRFTPRVFLENMLRDTASMSAGPFQPINIGIEWIINRTADACHLNLQDKHATQPMYETNSPYDGVAYFDGNEYRASYPFQILIMAIAMMALWSNRRHFGMRQCGLFLLVPLGCLSAMAEITRWQREENHLLIPVLALSVPVAAVAIGIGQWRRIAPYAALASVAALLPFALLFPRPLLGSQAIEFRTRLDLLARERDISYRDLKKLKAYMSHFKGRHVVVAFYGQPPIPLYAIEYALLSSMSPKPTFCWFNASIQVPGIQEPDPTVVISGKFHDKIVHHDTGTSYRIAEKIEGIMIYIASRNKM